MTTPQRPEVLAGPATLVGAAYPERPGEPRRRQLGLALLASLGLPLLALPGCGGNDLEDPTDTAATATAPTLALRSDLQSVASGSFVLNFSFSDPVASFALTRFTVSGGTVDTTSFAQHSSSEYSVAIVPAAGAVGTVTVTVPAGAFADSSGQASSDRAYTFAKAYNTLLATGEPRLTLTDSVGPSVATGSSVTYTFNFNADVGTSFTLANLVLAGGTATAFTKVTDTQYTLVLTPPATTSGTLLVTVPVGAFTSAVTGVSNQRETVVATAFRTS